MDEQGSPQEATRKLRAKGLGSRSWSRCPEPDSARGTRRTTLQASVQSASLPERSGKPGAWPLLLYLSTGNQLLSHGAKNSSAQEGSQRKTAWRAGSGPAASSEQVFAPWEVLGMFTPQGRGGVASAPGHLRALGGPGASTGPPQRP